jgi:hypothetical protein
LTDTYLVPLAVLCLVVCVEVKIVHYDPKKFDFGKKKAFPMRPQHFFTGVDKAMKVQNTSHASHSELEGRGRAVSVLVC